MKATVLESRTEIASHDYELDFKELPEGLKRYMKIFYRLIKIII